MVTEVPKEDAVSALQLQTATYRCPRPCLRLWCRDAARYQLLMAMASSRRRQANQGQTPSLVSPPSRQSPLRLMRDESGQHYQTQARVPVYDNPSLHRATTAGHDQVQMHFTRCLGRSHWVPGEGLLSRDSGLERRHRIGQRQGRRLAFLPSACCTVSGRLGWVASGRRRPPIFFSFLERCRRS